MFKFYKVPPALQMHEWKVFWEDIQAKHPVQYFFREALTMWWRVHINMRIRHWYWSILHKYHPKHQYHVLRPRSLEPTYHDPRERILHAVFDEVSTYAEQSLMGDGADGTRWTPKDVAHYVKHEDDLSREHFFRQVETEKQIIAIRNWWEIDRPKREQVEDDIFDSVRYITDFWDVFDPEFRATPEYKVYREQMDRLFSLEDEWEKEDSQKLKEVVDLLPHLWYT